MHILYIVRLKLNKKKGLQCYSYANSFEVIYLQWALVDMGMNIRLA
jgi:hypothetical protein